MNNVQPSIMILSYFFNVCFCLCCYLLKLCLYIFISFHGGRPDLTWPDLAQIVVIINSHKWSSFNGRRYSWQQMPCPVPHLFTLRNLARRSGSLPKLTLLVSLLPVEVVSYTEATERTRDWYTLTMSAVSLAEPVSKLSPDPMHLKCDSSQQTQWTSSLRACRPGNKTLSQSSATL